MTGLAEADAPAPGAAARRTLFWNAQQDSVPSIPLGRASTVLDPIPPEELATLMQFEHASLRGQMNAGHASIRDQLNSVDRRTARIEGHLFGIEIAPDQEDGE
ncbi:hypothetical protein [Candidatus Rariloculus sp.]|uniref:hypothetical protein n=1 Tax=Candidatus Rariloculus sp. TaxID=3101265 RepID=UPI003D12D55B